MTSAHNVMAACMYRVRLRKYMMMMVIVTGDAAETRCDTSDQRVA